MNTRLTAKIKSIFINITLLWSCAMAVLYIAVLFNTPVFSLLSLLPLGEWICEFLAMVLLFGIWAVPVLWLISLIFIIFTRIKLKEENQNKKTIALTIILPVLLAAFMLLTDFLDVLS